MTQDSLTTAKGGTDPRIFALARSYLDDTLSEPDAQAFERRLLGDREAREALDLSIAERRIRGHASGGTSPGAERCDECRALFPAYDDGTLAPAPVGRLSRHLEECPECADYYRSFAGGKNASTEDAVTPTKLRRAMTAAGFLLAGAVLALPVYRVLGLGPGAPAGGTAIEADDLAWPLLPVPGEELPGLAAMVREHVPDSDSDAVHDAMTLIARRNPGFLEAAGRSRPVAALLGASGVSGSRDRAVFLLTFLHDSRLGGKDRKEALDPLCGCLTEPGPVLWTVARTTDSKWILEECLIAGYQHALPADEPGDLRVLFDRAAALDAPLAVQAALSSLADTGHPDAAMLCRQVLGGVWGAFASGEFPKAAGPYFRSLSRKRGDTEARAGLERLLKDDLAGAGRIQVLQYLWSLSKSEHLSQAIVDLASDPDARVRKGVVLHIRDAGPKVDRSLLENLAADTDPGVSSIATQLLAATDRR